MDDDGVPLRGGNVGHGAVRIGDTVRKPAGPHTPAVHALLTHLHDVGFHQVPRPLGIDARGRAMHGGRWSSPTSGPTSWSTTISPHGTWSRTRPPDGG